MEIANMIKIEDLGLSIRTSCCLENMGIETIGQLADKGENELLKCKNFGLKCLAELIFFLTGLGIEYPINKGYSKFQSFDEILEKIREKYIN